METATSIILAVITVVILCGVAQVPAPWDCLEKEKTMSHNVKNPWKRYTADELRELPTLCTGQASNLKIDDGETRVWLCRCGIEDGMPFDDMISIERLINGRWHRGEEYPG